MDLPLYIAVITFDLVISNLELLHDFVATFRHSSTEAGFFHLGALLRAATLLVTDSLLVRTGRARIVDGAISSLNRNGRQHNPHGNDSANNLIHS